MILYEIVLAYTEDAETALDKSEIAEFREALRKMRGCFGELIASLNLNYASCFRW